MDVASIEYLLRSIGIDKVQITRSWVNSSCPFAPWLHEGGSDKHPSFGISIEPGGCSYYKCWGCDSKGSMLWFAKEYGRYSHLSDSIVGMLRAENSTCDDDLYQSLKSSYGRYCNFDPIVRKPPKIEEKFIPESDYSRLLKLGGSALEYIIARGYGGQIEAWGLRYSPGRVAIPVRTNEGKLVSISRRAINKNDKPKYLHTKGFRSELYLYGEDRIKRGGLCFVVEGFFDVINLYKHGYENALSLFGSSISDSQVDKIVDWFDTAVVFLDGDVKGVASSAKVQAKLSERIPTIVVRPPNGEDPGSMTKGQIDSVLGSVCKCYGK